MRFFLMLAPFFLSSACAQVEYLYSVSWNEASCTEGGDELSLAAIQFAVDGVLEADGLPKVKGWNKKIKDHEKERELGQAGTRGLRGLCNRRCMSSCKQYPACSEMFNCDECGRQLIETERILTDRELVSLEGKLVIACIEALETVAQTYGYSQECKDEMSGATCNALVYFSD
jgi:hypothetical protein